MMGNSELVPCEPSKIIRRGAVDRLRERLSDAKEQVRRLEALLVRMDKNPEVAELLNELSKEL